MLIDAVLSEEAQYILSIMAYSQRIEHLGYVPQCYQALLSIILLPGGALCIGSREHICNAVCTSIKHFVTMYEDVPCQKQGVDMAVCRQGRDECMQQKYINPIPTSFLSYCSIYTTY